MRRYFAVAILAISVWPCLAQERAEGAARAVTTRIVPVYPELAGRMHLAGVVKMRVTVAPDGAAKTVEVLGGNPVLVKAAQDAVLRWRWVAAPQETKELIELHFQPR
jgi:TonB family protein